ncbi:hypothetical protein D3C81_1129900 [compost metagenome]
MFSVEAAGEPRAVRFQALIPGSCQDFPVAEGSVALNHLQQIGDDALLIQWNAVNTVDKENWCAGTTYFGKNLFCTMAQAQCCRECGPTVAEQPI